MAKYLAIKSATVDVFSVATQDVATSHSPSKYISTNVLSYNNLQTQSVLPNYCSVIVLLLFLVLVLAIIQTFTMYVGWKYVNKVFNKNWLESGVRKPGIQSTKWIWGRGLELLWVIKTHTQTFELVTHKKHLLTMPRRKELSEDLRSSIVDSD